MANFSFNLERAGGVDVSPGKFELVGGGVDFVKSRFFSSDLVEIDESDKTSFLGTPVFSNLELLPGKFTPYGETTAINYEGLRIDTVLFTVTQQKNIIQTPIVGRQGTIKEYIADGDFVITCEGIIIGETVEGAAQKETGDAGAGDAGESGPILKKQPIGNRYPDRDVNRFVKLMEVPEALKFRAPFLERFGSFDLVVDSYDLPESRGASNYQVFVLRLLSDTPIELQ